MSKKSRVLAAPYILWMLIFTVIPLGIVAYFALTDASGAFTLDNFRSLKDYLPSFLRSVWLALAASAICLVIGYPVAYRIANAKPSHQRILYLLVMMPMCMSFLLRTLAWVAILDDTGIINGIVTSLGLGPLHLTRHDGAIVFGMVYTYLPFMIMPLYTVLMKIDRRLIEAAEDLGCDGRQVFLRVTLPLSVPGIVSGLSMVFVPAISTFYISQKLGASQTMLVGDLIEKQFNGGGNNRNVGAAISLLLMALVFVCVALMNHFDESDGEEMTTI